MVELGPLLRVRSAYAGRFDASGRHLVCVADLAGVPQVWGVPLETSQWPEVLLAPPDRAQTLHIGPRPGQFAIGADVGGNEHSQILYVDRAGGAWRALTDDADHIFAFGSFAPDGASISYAANTRDSRWFDIYVMDLASGACRRVLEHDGSNKAGPFSPNGQWLVVIRAFSNARDELWLVDVLGASEPRLLTRPNEETVYDGPQWSPDGRTLYVVTNRDRELAAPACLDVASGELTYLVEPDVEVDEATIDRSGRRLAYALNRDGEAEILVRDLDAGTEHVITGLPAGALYTYWQSGLAWDRDGERLAISWTASRANPNVYTAAVSDYSARLVTFAGGLEARVWDLVEPEHVTFPSFDGREIPALFYAPSNRKSGGPCVVFVHGGPESQYRPSFQPLVQYLVGAGFGVLAPNVRGSSGYGRTYVHLDDVRLRMDSVKDLAHAAYWLRDTGRANPQRIAVYGGSYGGFMVLAALTTNPELWAAGVDLVGIANFVTFLENTGPWRRRLREAEYGSLENDRDFLVEISPINKVDQVRAPLLVVHGANDPRVPIGEAEQMVAKLQSLGRTVEFLRLEDEGHQITKLKNKLIVFPRAVRFLRLYLMGEDGDANRRSC